MFLLMACTPTTVTTEDSAVVDTEGTEDTDTGTLDTDTGEVPEPPEWLGEYNGTYTLTVPVWTWEVCVGPIEVDVPEDGSFSFETVCTPQDGWGDGRTFDASFSGQIEDDGDRAGTTVFDFMGEGGVDATFEDDFRGFADDDEFLISWSSELVFSDGSVTVEGLVVLER